GIDPELVDVVAQVDDEIQVLGGQVAKAGIVAALPVLAGDGGEGEAVGARARRRGGAGPAGRGDVAGRLEAGPVPAGWRQAPHLDVNSVRQRRVRDGPAVTHDGGEAVVGGDLPAD